MDKLVLNLWFDKDAQAAVDFWTSIFDDSRITAVVPHPDPKQNGETLWVEFELEGKSYLALNGGPDVPFTDAASISIACDTQEEVDRYLDALTADGGKGVQCGWLTDKFGFRWQVVPKVLMEIQKGPDRERAARAQQAMLKMVKIDIAAIVAA